MNWGWAYDGVNASIPRNTGPECAYYLSTARHIAEGLIIVPLAAYLLKHGISKLPPLHINYNGTDRVVFGKQLLLITMTALLGLEMGFKLCTRTAIFILNPCHVTSMLQVYLLAAKPSKWTTTLFRIHIHYLNGPLLAFLFPEHDSRRITFELPTYYLQHGLMFVIPIYLLRRGGPYAAEKLTDFSYSFCAYGIFLLYHYIILEFFAVNAHVNLDHMICPAILDPFQGTNYRLAACTHQAILIPIVAKTFGYIFSSTSTDETQQNSIKSSPPVTTGYIDSADSTFVSSAKNHVNNDVNHSVFDDTKLVNAKANTMLHNECMVNSTITTTTITNITKGKQQLGNGCDIIDNSSFDDVSTISYPNDSNKKSQ